MGDGKARAVAAYMGAAVSREGSVIVTGLVAAFVLATVLIERRLDAARDLKWKRRKRVIDTIAGDILFNTRAALDHFAYQLVAVRGFVDDQGVPLSKGEKRDIYFPIIEVETAEEYIASGARNRKVKGMSQVARDAISLRVFSTSQGEAAMPGWADGKIKELAKKQSDEQLKNEKVAREHAQQLAEAPQLWEQLVQLLKDETIITTRRFRTI